MNNFVHQSLIVISLLQGGVSAVYYPESDGACPFKEGQLESNVKNSLNAHRISGPWVNIFDKKVLKDDYKCYGVNLAHVYPFPEEDGVLSDEDKMADVPKIFKYLKSTNTGESPDILNEEEMAKYQHQGEELPLIGFSYHAYDGFELHFEHPGDKSIANLKHKDIDLQSHPHLIQHGHDEQVDQEFDAEIFDSQFKRYAQVFDTDYDNYMVMYQCWETAQYFDKETNERIPSYEAFERIKSSQVDLKKNPPVEYRFKDDVVVKPRHFQNVQILWRARKKVDQQLTELDFEEDPDALGNLPMDYVYPDKSQQGQILEKVDELKVQISKIHPGYSMSTLDYEYGLLDHQNGRCDYDPYGRYDLTWKDETFGHLQSEDIDQKESTKEEL